MKQATIGNGLLRTMSDTDFAFVEPGLVRIGLPVRFQLHEAGRKIEQVYFPEDGVVSIVAATLGGEQCEVGMFGREGMSETATVLGTDYSPHEAYVQVAGTSAIRLSVSRLNEAFERSVTIRLHLLHYAQAIAIQLACSIVAASQTIEQRLARWLLMCHDRIDGDDIRLTNEFVGMMLNVRRGSVTVALTALEEAKMIARSRGSIVICDRDRLTRLTAGGYGLAEKEYERLIGIPIGRAFDTRLPDPA